MSTVLSQVLDAFNSVIVANVPAGTKVERERADAESREEAPLVNQIPHIGQITPFSAEMDQHEVHIELRIYVRAEPPTPAAELIHAVIHGPLMSDATLKSLVESIRLIEADNSAREQADITALTKVARYRCIYMIPKTTL